jgi:hypothetical protein
MRRPMRERRSQLVLVHFCETTRTSTPESLPKKMAFQIVEIELNADSSVKQRKVVPYPYQTRGEAVDTIEDLVARHAGGGYEADTNSWAAIDAKGNKVRFIIETV